MLPHWKTIFIQGFPSKQTKRYKNLCIRLFPSKEQTCIHQPLKLPQNSLPHQEIQAKVS